MPLKIGKYVSAASKQPASTIFLRPILSDSAPNTTKNGVAISSAAAIESCALVESTCSVFSRNNSA